MGNLVFQATLGGQVNLVGPNTASTFNLNVPAVSSTIATLTGTETFTNKTLTSPTLTAPVLGTPASGTLTNCTGLPNAGLVNSSVTVGSTAIALGATATTVAGLTSLATNTLTSAAATALTLQSAGTTAITVDTSQNVGIGTTSPQGKLQVYASANDNLIITGHVNASDGPAIKTMDSTATNYKSFEILSAELRLGGQNNILFGTSGTGGSTERMRIDTSGNLLVNTTNADAQIDTTPTSNQFTFKASDGIRCSITGTNFFTRSGDGTIFNFRRNATTVGTINVSTGATAYNTSSDYRLKENITPMIGALAKVQSLKPVTYTWKENGSSGEGFIAHELAEICPHAVTGQKDATREQEYEVTPAVKDEEGNITTPAVMGTRTVPEYQGIDTSFLVATLTAAIQELSAKNDALTARVVALEAK